jgi:hypothetical protein
MISPNQDRLKKIFGTGDDIISREIAGETLLVPIRGKLADMQHIFSLNPVAKYIWEHLNGELTLEDICIGLMKNFDVEEKLAEEDLHEFIDDLLKANLIGLAK